jgi:hypothetical protein
MRPSQILPLFDAHLKAAALTFEGVVIGGAALDLLGVTVRETQDCDVLDPEIPPAIREASRAFALRMALPETSLKENWLNNGPASLIPYLPEGWRARLAPLFRGDALLLHSLAREDLLATKLLAYCDRRQDLGDCVALKPSREELLKIMPWVARYDGNPDWPAYVEESFKALARRLGHEL